MPCFLCRAFWNFGIALSVVLATAAPAAAALVAYEPFDYAPVGSQLLSLGGGIGFSGPWAPGGFNARRHQDYQIAAGALDFGPLTSEGNHVRSDAVPSIAGLSRALQSPIPPTAQTTKYFSVLLRPEGQIGAGAFNGFFGVYLDGTGNSDLFFGKPGSTAVGNYVLENRGGAGQVRSRVVPELDQTVLLVVRGDFQSGLDTFTMWVDPVPGGREPSGGIVKSDLDLGQLSALTIYSTGAFSLDELRVGDTFMDVTLGHLLGDTNGDGRINVDDLNNVRNNFGARGRPDGSLMGDAVPFDGFVDVDDLNAVRNHFGSMTEAVPEPSSGLLSGVAATGLLTAGVTGRRRRR